MAEKILLKKYSNRRLYDTRSSQYVTLEDLTGSGWDATLGEGAGADDQDPAWTTATPF